MRDNGCRRGRLHLQLGMRGIRVEPEKISQVSERMFAKCSIMYVNTTNAHVCHNVCHNVCRGNFVKRLETVKRNLAKNKDMKLQKVT